MIPNHAKALLAIGALAALPLSAHAQYRRPPSESLSGGCSNVQTLQNGYVTAECRDIRNQMRWSSIYYPQCRSELSNENGMLACRGATASGGNVVAVQQPSTGAAIVGALASALLGTNNNMTLYTSNAQYPAWGEAGYGDPRTDPRFGDQGWGNGRSGQWVPMAQRQSWLEKRIAMGEQQGTLTRAEATNLRRQLAQLDRLETRYNRRGLTNTERADLDRRFDALSLQVRLDRQDSDSRWVDINQRQAQLDARIDAGVRDRSLSAREAASLRAEFQQIARMETNYRRNGLTQNERADLDHRFDVLSSRIRGDRQDNESDWVNINQRQAQLDARIDVGVRERSLSAREAVNLRAEFQRIARMEADYRRNGLTQSERADLDRRFDVLSNRIRGDRQDNNNRPSARAF